MEKRTTQSIPFHEGHEHLRKVNRSIRPAFGSRNNVSGQSHWSICRGTLQSFIINIRIVAEIDFHLTTFWKLFQTPWIMYMSFACCAEGLQYCKLM